MVTVPSGLVTEDEETLNSVIVPGVRRLPLPDWFQLAAPRSVRNRQQAHVWPPLQRETTSIPRSTTGDVHRGFGEGKAGRQPRGVPGESALDRRGKRTESLPYAGRIE